MFEWSSEVAIALSLMFCSWIVAEDDNEDAESYVSGDKNNSSYNIKSKLFVPSSDGDDETDTAQSFPHDHGHAMMIMVDPRIMYSDGVEVVAGNRGVVLNFSQMNGPEGKPLAIARVGMSRVQAEQLMGILHQVLYDMDNPGNKQLGSGADPGKSQ